MICNRLVTCQYPNGSGCWGPLKRPLVEAHIAARPRDPHILKADHAPTPFTAAEIRRGCPTGRTIRLRVEIAGQAPLLSVNRYVQADADGATVERTRFTLDGEPLGEAVQGRETWLDLQAHASFPADRTEITPERIQTPLGLLDCLRYTVTDGATEETFWFAKTAPGMPIKYTTHEAGQVKSVVTVIEDTL
jgi:hypothetical protein